MGLDRLQKGWSFCLISLLRTAAPAWPQLLTSLTSGTVCASQSVCGKVTKSPYDLWPSRVILCVLILRFDCNCAHVCAHMCVTTVNKRVEDLLWYVKSVCVRACVCAGLCVPTFIGHKLSLLAVALGWSCGAQCVGFDAGSGEKIRAQDESPKSHIHTYPC